MNIYHINTSAREGYTFEKPTVKFCVDNNELLHDSECVIRGDSSASNVYVIFFTQNCRGDIAKNDVHYFIDKSEADVFFKSVEYVKRSKMIKGYEIETHPIYYKMIDIPTKSTRINVKPEDLLWQKRKYEEDDLSFDKRIARLIEERSAL